MKKQQGIVGIFLLLLVLLAIAGGAYYLKAYEGKFCGGFAGNLPENQCPFGYTCKPDSLKGDDIGGKCESVISSLLQFNSDRSSNSKACSQEAKICPDGSTVSRVGPNCEFAECPAVNWETYTSVHGYSIKHPSNLFPTPDNENFACTTFVTDKNLITKEGFISSLEDLIKSGYTIEVCVNKVGYHSFDHLVSEHEKSELSAGRTPKFQRTTLDGYPALIEPTRGLQGKMVSAMKGDVVYSMRILCVDVERVSFDTCERKYPGLLQTFDQMLSTFKFTSQ